MASEGAENTDLEEIVQTLAQRLPQRALGHVVRVDELSRDALSEEGINDSTISSLLGEAAIRDTLRVTISLIVNNSSESSTLSFEKLSKRLALDKNPFLAQVRALIADKLS